jgi:hypothetical protein
MRGLLVTFVLGCAAAAGCRPDPVPIELEFPSTETFLYSELGQLAAYPVSSFALGMCSLLVEETLGGSVSETPAYDTGSRSICSFCNGGVAWEDVGEGPMAFVMVTRNDSNALLLAGCTMAEVYEGAGPVVINLYMTPGYDEVAAAGPPEFADPIRKCGEACE